MFNVCVVCQCLRGIRTTAPTTWRRASGRRWREIWRSPSSLWVRLRNIKYPSHRFRPGLTGKPSTRASLVFIFSHTLKEIDQNKVRVKFYFTVTGHIKQVCIVCPQWSALKTGSCTSPADSMKPWRWVSHVSVQRFHLEQNITPPPSPSMLTFCVSE